MAGEAGSMQRVGMILAELKDLIAVSDLSVIEEFDLLNLLNR